MSHVPMANEWLQRKKRGKKIDQKVGKLLTDTYEAFLRVGRVTADEWEELDQDEKACMLAAQKRIDIEQAIRIAAALRGGAAQLMSEVDGGKRAVREAIDNSILRFKRKSG